MSILNDSRNWYMKVSVRSRMLGEHVGRVRVVNFINPFKTFTEI